MKENRFRYFRFNKNIYIIALVVVLVVSVSIGYAILFTGLNINGSSGISANTWNIKFNNLSVTEGSVTADSPIITDDTALSYNVTLTKPGDFYEFSVNVVNSGSINAVLSTTPVLSGLTEQHLAYMDAQIYYQSGAPLKAGDILNAGQTRKIIIRLDFKKDLANEDLPSEIQVINLGFEMEYVQDMDKLQGIVKMMAAKALSDNGDYPNYNGIYLKNDTKDDDNPIYYYHGNVDKNNVKFAKEGDSDICWKIVRTTDTGGVKLIYNGKASADGSCNNTRTASQIGTSSFNSANNSPAYVGYKFGTPYTAAYMTTDEIFSSNAYRTFGNNISFSGGRYTLRGTKQFTSSNFVYNEMLNQYPYTCLVVSGTCDTVYYFYAADSTNNYYITLSSGTTNGVVFSSSNMSEMFSVSNSSNIYGNINSWYGRYMQSYTSYLEDTPWCNDVSYKRVDSVGSYLQFGYGYRAKPELGCGSSPYTVGNGKIDFPVGLLTIDEVTLAGGAMSSSESYLYTGEWWWTMSPAHFQNNSAYVYDSYAVHSTNSELGVRPAVSLKAGTVIADGDGSVSDPYVIK